MNIAIKTNKTNMERFLNETRNEKLIIYNQKQIVMYLTVSK